MPWTCFLADPQSDDRHKPGALWQTSRQDGSKVWMLTLPNGAPWNIYGSSSDGTPWTVTGDMPNITARPSISSAYPPRQGYHGWLTDGELSNDLEGRTYP